MERPSSIDAPPDAGEPEETATMPPQGKAPSSWEKETLPPSPWAGEEIASRPAEAVASERDSAAGEHVHIPGYEILQELGRGGMGVVYKARQEKLNRIVALKMVLAGAHAGELDLARFLSEAQAVAQLQHPNIVQLFESGQHNGVPYFTLEFVAGGSLSKRLAGVPLPPKDAANLVEQLAHGTHYAHEHGIVHRDLKPANILLVSHVPRTSPETEIENKSGPVVAGVGLQKAVPKITDFGLAKRMAAQSSLTASGAIMGTPSYMAPEQAGGGGKRVGPAADIYALGAILYECLTGRPPFQGATPMETVMQVLADEPVAPRQLQPRTPRDLETICLKCLDKQEHKRYGTAANLAEDLRRFQAGEPILARPIGRLGKAVKWVTRHRTVSALLGAIALAMILGTGFSVYFAFDASWQAEQARGNEAWAIRSAGIAKEKETEALAANAELEKANEALEKTLARGLIRPLGARPGPLTDAEIEALWELAASGSPRLAYRFVESAVSSRSAAQQLRQRGPAALHAAIGLDLEKRARVERLLADASADPKLSVWERADVSLIMLALGDLTPSVRAGAAKALLEAMLAADTGPRPTARNEWSEGMALAAVNLDADTAAASAGLLVAAMTKTKDVKLLQPWSQALSAVATRLDSKQAAKNASALMQAINRDFIPLGPLHFCTRGLSALAARMEPREAALLLTDGMTRAGNFVLGDFAGMFAEAAARMDTKDAAPVCSQVAALLTKRLKEGQNSLFQELFTERLVSVVAGMEPQAVARSCADAAEALFAGMEHGRDFEDRSACARGLVALAALMDRADADRVCSRAADSLSKSLEKTKEYFASLYLANSLTQVCWHMDPTKAAVILSNALAHTKDAYALQVLAAGMAFTAQREPDTARFCSHAVAPLLRVLAKERDGAIREKAAETFVLVAVHLEPKEATSALNKALTGWAARENTLLAQGLALATQRLPPREAAATLSKAIDRTYDRYPLLEGLLETSKRLEPREAVIALTAAMAKTKDVSQRRLLATGLAAAAARLDHKDAVAICSPLANGFVQAMTGTQDAGQLQQLAQSLSALAGHLDRKDAERLSSRGAKLLSDAIPKTRRLAAIASGLSALTPRLSPPEATAAAATLLQGVSKSDDVDALQALPDLLSACIAANIPPNDLTRFYCEATNLVAHAMAKVTDQRTLSQTFLRLLFRGDPKEFSVRSMATVGALGLLADRSCSPSSFASFALACKPLSSPLPTQELVNLLKQPVCLGQSRRVLLDQLTIRYRRVFADQWEFVRFAQEQGLALDFTSAPKR
jgi:hypothetical protein